MLGRDLKKIKDLLVLATSDGSEPGERTVVTKTALKLVEKLLLQNPELQPSPFMGTEEHDHSFLDDMFSEAIKNSAPVYQTRRGARPIPSGKSDTRIKAQAGGFCSVCEDAYPKGSTVVFLRETRKFCHTDCYAS